MASDCIIENLVMRNKTWLGFCVAIIAVWITAILGLILCKRLCLNLSWNDSRISLSNIINFGVAIGTIALAIFAWMAYKYTIEQYRKQKTIDISLEYIKQILSLLFFHKSKLDSNVNALNNFYLSEIKMLKNTTNSEIDNIYPLERILALKAHINNIEYDVNNFTNDWDKTIGAQLTLLNKIKPTPKLEQIKSNIDKSIKEISICFDSIKKYSVNESVTTLYSGHILIVNEIYELQEVVLKCFESILALDNITKYR